MTGIRTYRSLCRNFPLSGEDELVRAPPRAPTKGNNTPTSSSAVSRAQTPAPTSAPTPAPFRGIYTDMDLQRATKLARELFI